MDTYHPNKDDKTIGLQNRKIMTMVWSWSRFNSSCSCKKCPAVRETENSMKELKMSKWKKRSGGDWSFSRKIEPQSIDARSATTINHLLQEKSARREEKEFHCCVDNMSWKLFADWAITWAISLRYAQQSWAPIYISTRPRDSWRSRLSNEYFVSDVSQVCPNWKSEHNPNEFRETSAPAVIFRPISSEEHCNEDFLKWGLLWRDTSWSREFENFMLKIASKFITRRVC